jgi:hypothetical protein
MAVVTFDPAAFAAAYPEFATVPQARTTAMFTIAEQSILDNTDNAPVMDVNYRTQLFYMLIAHLLLIFGPQAPSAPNNTPPGRVANATEGTVSVGYAYEIPQGSAMAAWFNQTKYGALYWMSTARFRSAQYMSTGTSGVGEAVAYGAPPVPGFPNLQGM